MKINKRRPAFEYKLISDTDDIFSTIFERTPVAILIITWPAKEMLKVNSAALSLFKVKSVQALFKNYPTLFDKFTNEIFGDRDFLEMEIKLKKPRGSFVYLTAKARKFEPTKVILTLEDITLHKKKEKKLIKLAQLDGLTGLLNHKTLMLRFEEELSRAKRYHLPLSCFMFDVDNFKSINDVFGHLQGDEFLKKIAKILKGNMRESDIVGRYGGDEFLVIMPETPMSEAWIPARRIHSYLLEQTFEGDIKDRKIKNTFSIGISGFPLKGIETVKDLISYADKGLYEAKLKGGNQVVVWSA